VVPELWHRATPDIRVWSAGCSSGEEPYSLAILFHRYAATSGTLPGLSRLEVLGTDIDLRCLAAAERGEFEEGDFADTPDDIRKRYFGHTAPFRVTENIRPLVRFERRDMLTATAPRGTFDLIVCRNVLIYFDRETQERLFSVFHAALAPGGFLMLGKVETLLGNARSLFAAVDARERIFSRI
jgi:chemotaxis methyl-accepting protein methylase